jgi:hypothetical protein
MKRKRHPRPTTLRQQLIYVSVILAAIVLLYLVFFPIAYARRYPLNSTATMKMGYLLYSLEMDKTSYASGEKVDLRLAVKNTGNRTARLHFKTDGYADFIVHRDVNLFFFRYYPEVWRHLYTDAVRRVSRTISIGPGESRVFAAYWDQTDYSGKPVKPGRYIITGIMNTSGQKPELKITGTTK